MDLFGFAKDIGRRIFNKDEEAAENIKKMIEGNNPGVWDLAVDYDSNIVSLSGKCKDVEAREKCILMAGNVQGVIDVDASKLEAPKVAAPAAGAVPTTAASVEGTGGAQASAPPAAPKTEYYVIVSGDTLGKIAKKYYGNASKYTRIFEANREVIEDPNKIYPGQKIRIPLD